MTFIEMFCGIGGFRLGLERSGWKCVWANDIDKYACQVYRRNFGNGELVEGDIRSVDADAIPDHTLLTAGFPCQSFSLAGKRKGFEDARGTLFYDIARVAGAKRPPLLLLENVKGLLSNDGGRTFARILQTLDGLGYDVEWQVLNSKHFGVPQNRERVFIVGHLRGTGSRQIFPIGKATEDTAGACEETQGEGARFRGGYPSVDSRTGSTARGQHFVANSVNCEGKERNLIANTLSARYYKDGSENLIQIYDGHQKDNLVLAVQDVFHKTKRQHGKGFKTCEAYSLTARVEHGILIEKQEILKIGNLFPSGHEAGDILSPMGISETLRPMDPRGSSKVQAPKIVDAGWQIRRLTPTECERLQGFPDGWTKGVSDTQRYKLLGNAVTVNVVEFLGGLLRGCLQ